MKFVGLQAELRGNARTRFISGGALLFDEAHRRDARQDVAAIVALGDLCFVGDALGRGAVLGIRGITDALTLGLDLCIEGRRDLPVLRVAQTWP